MLAFDGGAVPNTGMTFCLKNCILVPGPKHMIDNVINDVLQKLKCFSDFQSSLKATVDALFLKLIVVIG